MQLSSTASADPEQYSVVLSSTSYAESPAGALSMFLAQMATGHVSVEVHNADRDKTWYLGSLGDQNAEDQAGLGLTLLARHAAGLSNHQKLELLKQVQTLLGLNPPA